MKLQRQSVGKVGDKEYYKYAVVIPNEEVEKADFKEGDELVAESKKGEVRLRKR